MTSGTTRILARLKSPSNSEVYKSLLEIRKNISNTKKGAETLLTNNVIPILVDHLKSLHENIVDVSLSILGNACLQRPARYQALEAGVSEALVHVLSQVGQRDSIRGRACRLVGNLAQDRPVAAELHRVGISTVLVSTLDPDAGNSLPTMQMAVRAVRLLWSVSHRRTEMLELNLVQMVASHVATTQDSNEGRELVKVALKALLVITNHCTEQCARQVHAATANFKLLITMAADPALHETALLTICNLCQASNFRPDLGIAGTIEIIVENLQDSSASYTDMLYQSAFSALCLLCRESVNRAKIRHAGGLTIFLEALQRETGAMASVQRSQALHALVQFVYDDTSVSELLQSGLVGVLSNQLAAAVAAHGCCHGEHKKRTVELQSSSKRFRVSSPNYQAVKKEQDLFGRSWSFDFLDEHEVQLSGDWSPSSAHSLCFSPGGISSPSPSSSSSSPPPTPTECDWPELYSPVTAEDGDDNDDDDDDVTVLVPCETVEAAQEDSENDSDAENLLPRAPSPGTSSDLCYILVLLSRVSHMECMSEGLASAPTLETLIDYVVQIDSPQPRASRIITRVVRNRNYFLPLVQRGFVLAVHSRCMRPQHVNCEQCQGIEQLGTTILRQMSLQAESSFGTGEIEHVLHRGEEETRTALALSIPHLIKVTRILRRLLLGCQGLDVIISTLRGEDMERCLKHAPHSLHALCVSLKICNPTEIFRLKEETSSYSNNEDIQKTTHENPVMLMLDCGTRVSVERDMLCSCSPVFAAMLSETGGWSEAEKREVSLHGVTAVPLHIMLSMATQSHAKQRIYPRASLVDTLDAIALLDRFLIDGADRLCTMVLQRFLTPSAVASVFLEAAQSGQPEQITCVRLGALRYLLVGKMLATERQQGFKQLLQSPKSDVFLSDLSRLIRSELSN